MWVTRQETAHVLQRTESGALIEQALRLVSNSNAGEPTCTPPTRCDVSCLCAVLLITYSTATLCLAIRLHGGVLYLLPELARIKSGESYEEEDPGYPLHPGEKQYSDTPVPMPADKTSLGRPNRSIVRQVSGIDGDRFSPVVSSVMAEDQGLAAAKHSRVKSPSTSSPLIRQVSGVFRPAAQCCAHKPRVAPHCCGIFERCTCRLHGRPHLDRRRRGGRGRGRAGGCSGATEERERVARLLADFGRCALGR